MMLAKDITPRHAARSTHVILVTNKHRTLKWPAQSMDLFVLLIRCAILQQFFHRYIISLGTMYFTEIAIAGGHTMY